MRSFLAYIVLVTLCINSTWLPAQEFDESFDDWPIDFKINGKIIVANELDDSEEVDAFFLRASGGDEAKIVVIALQEQKKIDASVFLQRFGGVKDVSTIISEPTVAEKELCDP